MATKQIPPRLHLFKSLLKTTTGQAFVAIYNEQEGDWNKIAAQISADPVLKDKAAELNFINQLADLSGEHLPLVKALVEDNKTNSLRELALHYGKAEWMELVAKTGVPASVPGDTPDIERANYVRALRDRLFASVPTAVIQRMIGTAGETPIADPILRGGVVTFLNNQGEAFDIKTMSVYEAFKQEKAFDGITPDLQEGVKAELKTLQRVAAISPVAEAIPVLMNAGLHTAFQVSEMPEAQFVRAFKDQLGDNGEAIARQLHTNAANARIRNEQALMALKEAGQGTGVAFIDKSLRVGVPAPGRAATQGVLIPDLAEALKTTLAKHNLSWDLLFGDADFCECGECTSVYSAASYFVELLQYLRNNNLNPHATGTLAIKTNPKDISGTPLQKLFDRRPDLACLQLSCQNTNTILPYVDLVNEVMENYLVYKHPKPFNVADETSGELLSEPQHTEYQAYCILKEEVYPFTLPYHQPIDAARIYLDHLGTSRGELIDTFRSARKATTTTEPIDDDDTNKPTGGGDTPPPADQEILDKLHEGYLDRAVDAEYLGLTQEEYVILTKEAFVSKEYWDKQCNTAHTLEEYQTKIGVKPVHQYYGYGAEGELLDDKLEKGLTFVKKQFLPRSGIQYADLVELLLTQCLNPNMPRDKAMFITENLHFSYRFLQQFKAVNGEDKLIEILTNSEKLLQLFPDLKGLPTFFNPASNDPALACPPSQDNGFEVSAADIRNWVKCRFARIGQMIVLENGSRCSCIGGTFSRPTKASAAEVPAPYTLAITSKCELTLTQKETISVVGRYDCSTGAVTLLTNTIPLEELQARLFTGNNGAEGYWEDGKLLNKLTKLPFSAYLKAKDTCDLDTVRLIHLDGSAVTVAEYDRIHRFIRLWRKLGWTIDEVDKALVGLGTPKGDCLGAELPGADDCNDCGDLFEKAGDCAENPEDCADNDVDVQSPACAITPDFLHQLVAVKKLLDKTGLELIKLLTFWTKISTVGEKSLYKRLFLTHNLLGMDTILNPDPQGNYLRQDAKISEHTPVILAALNLSADDLDAILQDAQLDDKLTIKNLSVILRYRLLSKALGLKVPAFISILPLFGNPFNDADTTLQFMERWGRMEEAGFDYRQLNYIIKNYNDPKKPLAPAEKTILQLAKTLYDGLNAIDAAHQDLKASPDTTNEDMELQAQATSTLVRSKAALLFDPAVVEQIMGILEGTSVFFTNAPKSLTTVSEKLDPKNDIPGSPVSEVLASLRKKIKYDATNGRIQITGILTLAETTEYLTWSNDPGWSAALTRIEKQQKKLFKAVLYDVFEAEKAKSPERKLQVEAAENVIKGGDVSMAFDQIQDTGLDPDTAAKKRLAFLDVFLPYLRQQLTHRFVVDTLAGLVGLDGKTTDALISEVLMSGTPAAPIYGIFEKIKDSAKPVANHWQGYLIPVSEGDYTFIVKDSDTLPALSLDGIALAFEAQEDPTNEWWSKPRKLLAGKLYRLSAGIDLKNAYWKTATSSIAALPPAVLLPDFASGPCEPAFVLLKKSAMLVSGFNLSADEIRYFNGHPADFGGLNFNQISLEQWLRLEAYTRLRSTLPQTQTNLLAFFHWAATVQVDSVTTPLSAKIAELTLWKKERIDKLIAPAHFNLIDVAQFRNEQNLLKLQKAIGVADKIGMDIDLLFDWAKPTSNFKKCRHIADSIEKAIRAQYKQTDWEAVVKPLSDKLRNHQKEALVAYLLQRPELQQWGVTDADALFEYFLIDVQMDACMETSRIKQAISSVQLFVQRCFLGLEEEHNGIAPDALDRGRWDWMQRYRVWEANRKVFLYPENWIESNLRDDKSPFFKELESELLQKDITKQNVTDALKAYLYKVDEVANLEVIGIYIEGNKDSGGHWELGAKLHVFARTRNAPYFFFYRYLALDEMNWYAWEKMQVDIPGYEVEDNRTKIQNSEGDLIDNPNYGSIIANGCYLVPVVWNGRLLIFFPQFMKKTKPRLVEKTAGEEASIRDQSDKKPSELKPIEFFEIKLAWSEYRNGKWTQKQVSKDAATKSYELDLSKYKFIPAVHPEAVYINVDCNLDNDGGFLSTFAFEGSKLAITDARGVNGTIPIFNITAFHKNDTALPSWQFDESDNRVNNALAFDDAGSKPVVNNLPNYAGSKFYDPYTHDLLGKINTGQLEAFFQYNLSLAIDKSDAFGAFDNDDNALTPNIYHELKRPYSLYNWELFFHTPMMLADALSKAQQFEEAMKWYHFVFNPVADGVQDNRFWQFSPFKDLNSQRILDSIFNNLQPNQTDAAINEWRNHPFLPHLVARSRPVAYMKKVVMSYLDNLVAWGDYLFRQDTIESINQATQLYILAVHILGPRPMMIPKRGKTKQQTYLGLLDKWDAFGNAMVELELVAPFSNQITTPIGNANGVVGFANVFGFSTALYFCIPNNPKLMGYWDTIADRLFKIRHCENIEGIFRMLPLFEPPIDPALLVQAAAQGLSIASVLNDLNTPMPNYRFYYLLQKALELCGELKSLGGALLSAIEKKDNEAIGLMRAKHESAMNNLIMEVKKQQLEEAQKSLETLLQNRIAPVERMKYYAKLSGLDESVVPAENADFSGLPNEIVTVDGDSGLKLIPYEKEDMDKASKAQDKQLAAALPEKLASILFIIPNFSFDIKPLGVGLGTSLGGSNLGAAAQAWAKFLQLDASELSYASSSAGKKGGFTRALQERVFQANAAGYEIKQIDKQITAQQIRINIANLDIANQQKMIDNAAEIEDFLKNKYSNEELYTWMRSSLKTLYHQVYSLAFDLAKKCEKVYRFERGLSSSNFIQAGYWDAGRDGLLAGEQLYVGLKQLEAAYQENRGYDYEITKHISLRQINPLAVLQFRETGKCEFELPEISFDMDYPGHFKRRIKSVSLSVPCIAGPYTNINATLRLLENKFRNTALAKDKGDYPEKTEASDDRFSTYIIPISAIAASSAQNDSGMFELNFKDERYLPFEGAGATSKWRLELPNFRQFDYNTISDIVVHLRYISTEGGERLKKAAYESAQAFLSSVEDLGQQEGLFSIIDLVHDLPTEWHHALQNANGNSCVLTIKNVQDFMPYLSKIINGMTGVPKTAKVTDVWFVSDPQVTDVALDVAANPFTKGAKIGGAQIFSITGQDLVANSWALTIENPGEAIQKAYLIMRFVL